MRYYQLKIANIIFNQASGDISSSCVTHLVEPGNKLPSSLIDLQYNNCVMTIWSYCGQYDKIHFHDIKKKTKNLFTVCNDA